MNPYKSQKQFINKMMNCINPSECPNFYLYGDSEKLLEYGALEISDYIERNCLMNFKGIVKHFSMIMPYFRKKDETDLFVKRCYENISIAREYYNEFSGIIIIQLSDEWCTGYNQSFEIIRDFINANPEICFILIESTEKNKSVILNAFSQKSQWFDINLKPVNENQCIKRFERKANALGYSIDEATKRHMLNILEKRNQYYIDNEQFIEELIFALSKEDYSKKIIYPEDINLLLQDKSDTKAITIGFNYEGR